VEQTTGLDGWWVALQFDKAVVWFGRYVEAKCSETDDHGNHRHSLETLLGEKDTSANQSVQALIALFGVIEK